MTSAESSRAASANELLLHTDEAESKGKGKDKGKDKGKGKGKDKGENKGKDNGKGQGKDKRSGEGKENELVKGKSKGDVEKGKGKDKGKDNGKGKGKGKGTDQGKNNGKDNGKGQGTVKGKHKGGGEGKENELVKGKSKGDKEKGRWVPKGVMIPDELDGVGDITMLATEHQLFDMDAIRDITTLEPRIITDWHHVHPRANIATREKIVSIHVGEFWPGQEYRVPIRMVVPAEGKARGFFMETKLPVNDLKLEGAPRKGLGGELIREGVGLVQVPVGLFNPKEHGELGKVWEGASERFAKTPDGHLSGELWAWPATIMRAVTAAYAETEYFEEGKVALAGNSKHGATPSICIIHDTRITAVYASQCPIWPSPLRLYKPKARNTLFEAIGKFKHFMLGGLHGGNFYPALGEPTDKHGNSAKEFEKLAERLSGSIFVALHLEAIQARGAEVFLAPGTHDFVAYDVPWGGRHYPRVPLYLKAGDGHGKRIHPKVPQDDNVYVFMLAHYFDGVKKLLDVPTVTSEQSSAKELRVIVRFEAGSASENGRIWWMFDRPAMGSTPYLALPIPDENWVDMEADSPDTWTASIPLLPNATTVDFFSSHLKTVSYKDKKYATYTSCPYTRVKLQVA